MKKATFLFFSMISIMTYGQTLVDKWDNTYSADATVNDIIVDSNGNVYTLFSEDNGTDSDIKLIKHNNEGTQQWVRTYASSIGNDNDYGIKLQLDASDNIYFLGSINPEETSNGFVLKKYNATGTQQYEYVNTSTVGPVPYDFVISSSNEAFVSSKRYQNSTEKENARLYRINSSGSYSALATYNAGGAGTDQIGYRVGISGSDVKMAVVDNSSFLRILTFPTNFSTGTDTQTGNRRSTFSNGIDTIEGMHVVDAHEIYIYGKEDGVYFIRREDTSTPIEGTYTVDIPNMDQINSMYVDASSNVYLTGHELTGSPLRNQLVLEKYNSSGVQQFDSNLKPDGVINDHDNEYSSGVYVDEDASGNIVVIGNLAKENETVQAYVVNDFVGTVIFDNTGEQLAIEPSGHSGGPTVPIQAGIMDENGVLYFAGQTGATVYFYSQCDPPSVDLGGDVSEDYNSSGNSLMLDAGAGFDSYLWSTGATTQTIMVTEEGDYDVTVTNAGGCPATDEMTYSIDPIDQTITWSQTLSNQSYADGTYALSATASSDLAVSFSSSDTDIAETVFDGDDWEIQFNGVGTVTITAAQAGDENYNAATSVDKVLTIDVADFYWVGNGGDYEDFATHWATTSGGSTFHTIIPDEFCNVHFDENSFSLPAQEIEQSGSVACHDMTVTNVSGTPEFDIQNLYISGSLDFPSNVTYSIYAITFGSDEVETIDFNGSTIEQGFQTERWSFTGDGSWEFTDDVVFNANYINVFSGDIVIGNGVAFTTHRPITLYSGTTLTNNGALTFESGANFLNEPGSSFTGNDFTFKRNTTFDASTGKYSIVGSPITSASTSALGSLVYEYDESQDAVGNDGADRFIEVSTPETMPAGKGYFSAYTGTISVTGMPNTGTINIPLDYSTSGGGEAAFDGFNLVSNPYPAGLEVEDFIDVNGPDGTNAIGSALYLWVDGGSDAGQRTSSDYMTVNGVGTTGGNSARSGDYNTLIGSFQGFFVKATGTGQTLSFTESMRHQYGSFDNNFFRKEKEEMFKINVGLTSETAYSETLVGYLDDATIGVDALYDAERFSGNSQIGLSTLIGKQDYAIQGRPLSSDIDVLVFTFQTKTAGQHTLDFRLEAIPDGADIILLDKFLDESIAISNDSKYDFTSSAGSFSDRFELLVSSRVITGVLGNEVNSLVQYQLDGNQLLAKSTLAIQAIEAYDLHGKLLSKKEVASPAFEMSLPMVETNMVIIRAYLENGTIQNQKLQIK